MDALVAEGIDLAHSYVFYCCSPTRSSLQSGRNPVHVNVLNADPDIFNASNPTSGAAGVARNMTGIGTKMAAAGYRTHFVGKWGTLPNLPILRLARAPRRAENKPHC